MPEARRRELDEMLRGLAPRHQRQLSISTSNALDMFSVIEVIMFECISASLVSYARVCVRIRLQGSENDTKQISYRYSTERLYLKTYYCSYFDQGTSSCVPHAPYTRALNTRVLPTIGNPNPTSPTFTSQALARQHRFKLEHLFPPTSSPFLSFLSRRVLFVASISSLFPVVLHFPRSQKPREGF